MRARTSTATGHTDPADVTLAPPATSRAATSHFSADSSSADRPIADRVIRVLVVDDHTLIRAGLRAMLEPTLDIEIVGEAASGEEAISIAEALHPDLILMDLDMPGGGGIAATRVITARDEHPRVVVLTMHVESERLLEALKAGATGYMTKDVAPNELVAAIRTVAAGDVHVRSHAGALLAEDLRLGARPTVADEPRRLFAALSTREQAVLRLVAEGYTGPEIGRSLGITSKTVDTYRQRIHQKAGIFRRSDYVRFALRIDILKK